MLDWWMALVPPSLGLAPGPRPGVSGCQPCGVTLPLCVTPAWCLRLIPSFANLLCWLLACYAAIAQLNWVWARPDSSNGRAAPKRGQSFRVLWPVGSYAKHRDSRAWAHGCRPQPVNQKGLEENRFKWEKGYPQSSLKDKIFVKFSAIFSCQLLKE